MLKGIHEFCVNMGKTKAGACVVAGLLGIEGGKMDPEDPDAETHGKDQFEAYGIEKNDETEAAYRLTRGATRLATLAGRTVGGTGGAPGGDVDID